MTTWPAGSWTRSGTGSNLAAGRRGRWPRSRRSWPSRTRRIPSYGTTYLRVTSKERVQTLTTIGDLQRRIGRMAEALRSSQRAAAIAAELSRERRDDLAPLISWGHTLVMLARLEREVGGAVSAETRAALGEVGQQLERFPDPRDAGALYNLACLYSVLSGLGPPEEVRPADPARGEQNDAADRAMAALHRAVAAGWNDLAP